MFKHLKNEKGVADAVAIFLIGLIFTMFASANEVNKLEAQLEKCESPQIVSIDIDK